MKLGRHKHLHEHTRTLLESDANSCFLQVDGETDVRITAILAGRKGAVRGGSSSSGSHRIEMSRQSLTVDSRCMRTLDSFVQARGMNYDAWWLPQSPHRVRRLEVCGVCPLAATGTRPCEGGAGACVNTSRAMLHWLTLFHGAGAIDALVPTVREAIYQSSDRPSTSSDSAADPVRKSGLFPEVVVP